MIGLRHGYGTCPTEEESIRLIHKAFELGCTLFDTAEAYGPYTNEELVGKALKPTVPVSGRNLFPTRKYHEIDVTQYY